MTEIDTRAPPAPPGEAPPDGRARGSSVGGDRRRSAAGLTRRRKDRSAVRPITGCPIPRLAGLRQNGRAIGPDHGLRRRPGLRVPGRPDSRQARACHSFRCTVGGAPVPMIGGSVGTDGRRSGIRELPEPASASRSGRSPLRRRSRSPGKPLGPIGIRAACARDRSVDEATRGSPSVPIHRIVRIDRHVRVDEVRIDPAAVRARPTLPRVAIPRWGRPPPPLRFLRRCRRDVVARRAEHQDLAGIQPGRRSAPSKKSRSNRSAGESRRPDRQGSRAPTRRPPSRRRARPSPPERPGAVLPDADER